MYAFVLDYPVVNGYVWYSIKIIRYSTDCQSTKAEMSSFAQL